MDVGLQLHASRSCEALLTDLGAMGDASYDRYEVGTRVIVHGLSSKDGLLLNGLHGAIEKFDESSARYTVNLGLDRKKVRLVCCFNFCLVCC